MPPSGSVVIPWTFSEAGVEAVAGEQRCQLLPCGVDKASAGEARIFGDFRGHVAGWSEGKHGGFVVEFRLGKDEAVQWRGEDVNAERWHAMSGLDQYLARQ